MRKMCVELSQALAFIADKPRVRRFLWKGLIDGMATLNAMVESENAATTSSRES